MTSERGGRLTDDKGLVALDVSARALQEETELTVEAIAPPWPAVAAWEFGPDGTTFMEPATLEIDYSTLTLPPGVDPSTLRLGLYEDGRWIPLEDSINDATAQTVTASVEHFSIYGLYAYSQEDAAWDDSWSKGGVTVTTSDDRWGRLRVGPDFVGLYLSAGTQSSLTVSFSGLPVDWHSIYVDGVAGLKSVVPADNGSKSFEVDGTREHFIWVQPADNGAIYRIGGSSDQCSSIGTRDGDVCKLTGDVNGAVIIEEADQVLDCDGYAILQGANLGTGIGVLVSTPPGGSSVDDVTVQDCFIGGPSYYFGIGTAIVGGSRNEIRAVTSEENETGIHVMGGSDHVVLGNSVAATLTYRSFIRVTEDASGVVVSANDIYGTTKGDAAIELDGSEDDVGVTPVTVADVRFNTIDHYADALQFRRVANSTIRGNTIEADIGLLYLDDVASMSVFWNDIVTSGVGVHAGSSGPAIEVSDGVDRGNWWSHSCSGSLFTAGTDSSRSNVVDSYPYAFSEAWERGATTGCDSTAPSAPTIDFPLDEAVVLEPMFAFSGRTEAHAVITVTEGVNDVVSGRANSDGDFYLVVVGLEADDYEFVFTATDPHGNVSGSVERDVTVEIVDENNPHANGDDSVILLGISDAPNRFNPSASEVNEMTVVLDVKVPADPEDGSYFVFTERRILEPVNREELDAVYAVTEFDPDNEVNGYVEVTVVDAWDGRDHNDALLDHDLLYPYEADAYMGRIPDNGSCETWETPMLLDADQTQAFVSSTIILPGTWGTSGNLCCITTVADLARDFVPAGRLDLSTFQDDDEKEEEPYTCAEAYLACGCVEWNGFTDEAQLERCVKCRDACIDNYNDCNSPIWPTHLPGGLTCGYNSFKFAGSPHDASNAPDPNDTLLPRIGCN